MRSSFSLLQTLQANFSNLRTQTYFKATLTALSHAMEDMLLVGNDDALIIASFQQGRFYRQEYRRYQRIAKKTDQVYVLATGDSDFFTLEAPYHKVELYPEDLLAQEWHLIILGMDYASCIVCQESASPVLSTPLDSMRQFKGIWTFDRELCSQAAKLLLEHLAQQAPQLYDDIQHSLQKYSLIESRQIVDIRKDRVLELDAKLFTDRLVTYLQASQYKQLKAYRTIAAQEEQQRLINTLSKAIQSSLLPEDILEIAVGELGKIFNHCRCLVYQIQAVEESKTVVHEYISGQLMSLKELDWSMSTHPLFEPTVKCNQPIIISDVAQDTGLLLHPSLKETFLQFRIEAFLLIPIMSQDVCLGYLEIHQPSTHLWIKSELDFLSIFTGQVGVALLQGQAYESLKHANTQLLAMERTQRSLIAIVGHELKTPLSAIQICLETLATSSVGLLDYHRDMLSIALDSSEQLKNLIHDFLLLSQLENSNLSLTIEPIAPLEYIQLVASKFQGGSYAERPITLLLELPSQLPLVMVEGELFMIVLSKILDNAFKFTEQGQISITAHIFIREKSTVTTFSSPMLQITISDTGMGIEQEQLKNIFEQFFQAEDFLCRKSGGTGLGLSICQRIITKLGGEIWARSSGKEQGSQFCFTVPIGTDMLP